MLMSMLSLASLAGCFNGENKSRFFTYCDRTGCYQCDENGCGPLAGLPPGGTCDKAADCAPGCFCGTDGKCAEAGFCDKAADCAAGYVCNTARHSCEPTGGGGGGGGGVESTVCKSAADCPTYGECVNGVCKAAPVLSNHCVFNRQCGAGGVCQDGRCQKACQDDSACGTGRACLNSRCVPRPPGNASCIANSACGAAQTCINSACHLSCTKDSECQAANSRDVCWNGLCRPDETRVAECRMNADCAAGRECVDAVCRDFCWASSDCAGCTDGPVCSGGYCMTAGEANPQCRLSTGCNGGHCTNGACE